MREVLIKIGYLTFEQWFGIAFQPLTFLLVGVYAKRLGRPDGDKSPKRNDWAVSTSILLMTFAKIVGDFSESKANGLYFTKWLISIFLAFIFSIDHERYRSWDASNVGNRRLWMGIVLPDLVAVTIFASYQLRKMIDL